MNSKRLIFWFAALLSMLLVAACNAAPAGETSPTDLPPVVVDTNIVAEARLVPRESVQLAFLTSGQVDEVLVEKSDTVKTGDVVARLGDREEIESTIANAEAELLASQQALQKLEDDLPEERTAALQALKNARDEVRDAERKISGFDVSAEPLDIEVARANVALAKRALDQAEKDYKPYKNKPEDNYRRAAFLSKLADAQERYDEAVKRLNRMTGVITAKFELDQAQTELSIAQDKLAQAEEQHELLKNGPDPDDVAAANARINAAQAALSAAQAALDNLELRATIDGTIVELDLVVGQRVSAGAPVMTIADLSQMYVETDDLTEIEVVDVSPGQKASIFPDALPDLELSGTVESISQVFEEKRGDITYTARIRLDSLDPRLRWGMTLAVTFEE